MATITINIEDPGDASDACREVASLIESGYFCGMIGYSGDTWDFEL